MHKGYGKLFLIPNFLSKDNTDNFLPALVRERIHHIKNFIVETEKDARALIKKLNISTPQNELNIFLWNEHSNKNEVHHLLKALENESDAGVMSDAGLPCVADPGNDIVSLAHQKNIEVIPLPGASSIFMALMGSGMSGQHFIFHGYLPIDKIERVKKIKHLESESVLKNQTQIFMEAPYRNNHLLDDIIKTCSPLTKLCIASDVSGANQFMKTKTINDWGSQKPNLHKIPTIFIIG